MLGLGRASGSGVGEGCGLGQVRLKGFFRMVFAECQVAGHSAKNIFFIFLNCLCRVPGGRALGKDFFFVFRSEFFCEAS